MSCCAINCTNRPARHSEVQFFRFPSHDEARRRLWVRNLRRMCWDPSPSSRVCSAHFEEDYFTNDAQGKRRLTSNTVPTIFSFPGNLGTTSSKGEKRRVLQRVNTDISSSPVSPSKVPEEILKESRLGFTVRSDSREGTAEAVTCEANTTEAATCEANTCEANTCEANTCETATCETTTCEANTCEANAVGARLDMDKWDHCYTMWNNELDPPLLLKRKYQEQGKRIIMYRKKLRIVRQRSRRLKKNVCSLKKVTKELRKELLVANQRVSLLEAKCQSLSL